MLITICASTNFSNKIIEIKNELEKIGHKVNIPYFTEMIMNNKASLDDIVSAKENGGDFEIRKAQPVDLIKRYWDFIKNSDAVLILNLEKNGINNYIGGSVLMEMGFAYGHNKKIYLYNPIPEKSERIHYLDEIKDMKPIIVNGDLSQIK